MVVQSWYLFVKLFTVFELLVVPFYVHLEFQKFFDQLIPSHLILNFMTFLFNLSIIQFLKRFYRNLSPHLNVIVFYSYAPFLFVSTLRFIGQFFKMILSYFLFVVELQNIWKSWPFHLKMAIATKNPHQFELQFLREIIFSSSFP